MSYLELAFNSPDLALEFFPVAHDADPSLAVTRHEPCITVTSAHLSIEEHRPLLLTGLRICGAFQEESIFRAGVDSPPFDVYLAQKVGL